MKFLTLLVITMDLASVSYDDHPLEKRYGQCAGQCKKLEEKLQPCASSTTVSDLVKCSCRQGHDLFEAIVDCSKTCEALKKRYEALGYGNITISLLEKDCEVYGMGAKTSTNDGQFVGVSLLSLLAAALI